MQDKHNEDEKCQFAVYLIEKKLKNTVKETRHGWQVTNNVVSKAINLKMSPLVTFPIKMVELRNNFYHFICIILLKDYKFIALIFDEEKQFAYSLRGTN